MKIERVDENTIKCYLTLDELREYDVDYKDFLSRSEKAQILMKEIIEQAKEQVGYQPPSFAFEMQITMVPEQGMVLTFSEKEPFDITDEKKVEGFLNNVKGLLERVGAAKKDANIEDMLSPEKVMEAIANATGHGAGAPVPKTGEKQLNPVSPQKRGEDKQLHEAVYAFRNIGRVIEFAKVLPKGLRMKSRLYKMDDKFFLYLGKGKASFERFSCVCVQALEFSALYKAGEDCEDLLKERGELLIEEKALRKLAK